MLFYNYISFIVRNNFKKNNQSNQNTHAYHCSIYFYTSVIFTISGWSVMNCICKGVGSLKIICKPLLNTLSLLTKPPPPPNVLAYHIIHMANIMMVLRWRTGGGGVKLHNVTHPKQVLRKILHCISWHTGHYKYWYWIFFAFQFYFQLQKLQIYLILQVMRLYVD